MLGGIFRTTSSACQRERAGGPDPKRLRDVISSSGVKFWLYLQLDGSGFDATGNDTSAGADVFTIKRLRALLIAPQG